MEKRRCSLSWRVVVAMIVMPTFVVGSFCNAAPDPEPSGSDSATTLEAIPAPGRFRPINRNTVVPAQPAAGMLAPGLPLVPQQVPSKPESIFPMFQVGNTYRFVKRTEVETAGEKRLVLEAQLRYDAKVRLDGKTGVTLTARVERLDLSLQSGGVTLQYNSMKPEDQQTPIGKHLRASWKHPVDLILDPKGQIDGVQAYDVSKEVMYLLDVPRFDLDEIVQLVEGLPQGFPKRRVVAGETWRTRGTRPVGDLDAVEFSLLCRFAGAENFEDQKCFVIEMTGTCTGSLPGGEGVDKQMFEASQLSAKTYFDPLDKMIRFSEQQFEIWVGYPSQSEDEPDQRYPIREKMSVHLLHVIPTT